MTRAALVLLGLLLVAGQASAQSAAPAAAPATAPATAPAFALPPPIPNHRAMMRDILEVIARYAKQRNPGFVVLAHGATGLIVKETREDQLERINDPDDRMLDTRIALGGIYRTYVRLFDGLVVNEFYCDRADALIAENAARNVPRPPPRPPTTDAGTPYVPRARAADPTPFEQKTVQQLVQELIGEDIAKAPVAPSFPGMKTPQMIAAELAAAEREARLRQFRDAVEAMRRDSRKILSIDPCNGGAGKAIAAAAKDGALTFPYADNRLRLDSVPRTARPPHENANPVLALSNARNFLVNLSSARYGSRADWVAALAATNYDLLILDVFHRSDALTQAEVRSLKFKKVGAPRLVLAAMQIGRAFDTRFYWKPEWKPGTPPFLALRDATTPGAIHVEYWDPAWKEILGRTIAGIMDLGFDGVMFTDIDTFKIFEERTPLDP